MSWQPEIDELRRREELARAMGGEEKVARQHAAGRLTVRERIAALLDGGAFEELGAPAGRASYTADGSLEAFRPANFVLGMGAVGGRRVVVGVTTSPCAAGARDAALIRVRLFRSFLPSLATTLGVFPRGSGL